MTPHNEILVGDAVARLRELATGSVDCVVTSPPFFMQRDYGVDGQIGLEENVETWTERLRIVMAEIHRVLVDSGSLWIDLCDTYSRSPKLGAPTKSLLLAPERLALALVGDGWRCRSKVIWAKRNPMPASVGDRLTNTYDVVLHLVKQDRYHYDLDAIRVPQQSDQRRSNSSAGRRRPEWAGPKAGTNSGLKRFRPPGVPIVGKNPGDLWMLPTARSFGTHHATFPEGLVERPLLATCPLKVCTACQTPWRREPGKTFLLGERKPAVAPTGDRHVRRYPSSWRVFRQLGPLVVGCTCGAPSRAGLVLDPFFGSGTVAVVAERLGRDWIGIELSADYAELARQRLGRGSPSVDRAA